MEINSLFKRAVDMGSSDLHLRVGLPPILRIDGNLKRLEDLPIITNNDEYIFLLFPCILHPLQIIQDIIQHLFYNIFDLYMQMHMQLNLNQI